MSNQNTASKKPAAPVYLGFLEELKARIEEMKVPVRTWELKNFVGFESTVNKHKFYVPKSATEMGLIDTTLEIPAVKDLIMELEKPNGKIARQVIPDVDLLASEVLPLFASSEEQLRANRRPTRRKTGEQTVVQPADASEPDTSGAEELASWEE